MDSEIESMEGPQTQEAFEAKKRKGCKEENVGWVPSAA